MEDLDKVSKVESQLSMTFHKLVDLISDRQQNVYQLLLWIVAKNVYLLGYFLLFQQIETVFCDVKPSFNIYISGYILYRHY